MSDYEMTGDTGAVDEYDEDLAALPQELWDIDEIYPDMGMMYYDDAEEYMEALGEYASTLEDVAAGLEESVGSGDAEELSDLISQLIDASHDVGAKPIEEDAKLIEVSLRSGEPEEAEADAQPLADRCYELADALKAIFDDEDSLD